MPISLAIKALLGAMELQYIERLVSSGASSKCKTFGTAHTIIVAERLKYRDRSIPALQEQGIVEKSTSMWAAVVQWL